MKILVAVILACSLPACGQAQDPGQSNAKQATAKLDAVGPAPVTDASAPTVADLQRRGLVRVDDEPSNGWDCGPACVVDAFSAIYMGKDPDRNPPDRQFICPVTGGEMETWRCRTAEPWHV